MTPLEAARLLVEHSGWATNNADEMVCPNCRHATGHAADCPVPMLPQIVVALEQGERLRAAAERMLSVHGHLADHYYVRCTHPTTQDGGDGCHRFASCHAEWPGSCDIYYEAHPPSGDPELELRAALHGQEAGADA